ncbi:hypothetical protein MCEMZLE2_00030 [Candidatus Nanopelagicaceae bacterium]
MVRGDALPSHKEIDVLILDLSDQDTSPSEQYLGEFKFVVGFDWCKSFAPDINFVVFPHSGKFYPSKIKTYVGFEYLVLDKRFTLHLKEANRPFDKFQLISIGFSAKSRRISEVIDVALKISDLPIKICTGIELDLIHKEPVQLLKDPDNYVDLVRASEIIYTNGASTLLEAILLKKKIVAFPQTIAEESFLAEIESRLGVDFRAGKASKAFPNYDPAGIFDTKGGARILDALGGHLL